MKINKSINAIVAALALPVLVGCTDTEDLYIDVPNDNSIGFTSYIGRNSRAESLTSSNLNDFGVFAYHDNGCDYASGAKIPNYMYNQMVCRNGNDWTYNPIKYWPADATEKVSFFAYAPFCMAPASVDETTTSVIAMSENDASGDPTIRFSVGTDVSKQIDLLYAKSVDCTNAVGTVNMEFKHALSRVGFKVIGWEANSGVYDDNTTVTINAVKLATNRQSATLNLNTGSWENPSESETLRAYTLSTRNGLIDNNVIISGETEAKCLNKADDYIMMLPDMSGDDQYVLFVDYTVETNDANLSSGSHIIRNNVYSRFTPHFEAGKAYCINIHLGLSGGGLPGEDNGDTPVDPDPDPENPVTPTPAGNAGSVRFSAVVEEWNQAEDIRVPNVHDGLVFSFNNFNIDIHIAPESRAASSFTALSLVREGSTDNVLKSKLTFSDSEFSIPSASIDYENVMQGDDYVLTLSSTNGDIYQGRVNMGYASMELTIDSSLANTDGFYVPFAAGTTPAAIMFLWGDGSQSEEITTMNYSNRKHKYQEDGVYSIKILSSQPDYNKQQIPYLAFSESSGGNSSWNKNQNALISVDTPILNVGSSLGFIFGYCKNLVYLADGVFSHCTNATNLDYAFQKCTSLEAIPANLVEDLTNLESMQCTFQAASKISEIPANLLKNNVKLKRLNGCFSELPELKKVPKGLFDNNVEVTNFHYVFGECQYLNEVPAGLFANNLKVTDFSRAFDRAYRLYEFENVFINSPEEKATRFASVDTEINLNETFHMIGKYVGEIYNGNVSGYRAVNFHEYNIPNGFTGKPYASANPNFANYQVIADLY